MIPRRRRRRRRRRPSRLPALSLLLCLALAAPACTTIGYYAQAVSGQVRLLNQRRPVDGLIADTSTPANLKQRLRTSRVILEFAEQELALRAGGRYDSYVQLEEDHVVWNLVAVPELSTTPKRWCYPFVGCAEYRGFFRYAAAREEARRLQAAGYETHVGGVAAYSTLGWFDDPLLSSFIDYDDARLAELLIHELAHGRVWLAGDVRFNESFATFVGERGALEWLRSGKPGAPPGAPPDSGDNAEVRAYLAARSARQTFTDFALRWRDALTRVLSVPGESGDLRLAKARVMAAYRGCYARYRSANGPGPYDGWVARANNASLAAVGTYNDLVNVFERLFEAGGERWPDFYEAVEDLSRLSPTERIARIERLAGLAEKEIAADTDDDRADEIQCQALAGHGLDGKGTGAEDDHVGRGGDG